MRADLSVYSVGKVYRLLLTRFFSINGYAETQRLINGSLEGEVRASSRFETYNHKKKRINRYVKTNKQ